MHLCFAAVLNMAFLLLPQSPAKVAAADFSGQASIAGKGPARESVVYLEGEKKAAPLAKVVVDQRGKKFIPHVTAVTVGTTVEFPNNDAIFHNVFAYFDAKKFDLGMYPRGTSKAIKFDKTGYVSLLCNVHSEMSAYIVIVDTPYFCVTDREGVFRIKGVPPGTYTLNVWHESGAKLTEKVQIKGEDVSTKLVLSRK